MRLALVKTIVEGLARAIDSGDVPRPTKRNCVFSGCGRADCGTRYRGDFENRMKAVVRQLELPDAVLFVDEIHTLIGAGAASGWRDGRLQHLEAAARCARQNSLCGATTA